LPSSRENTPSTYFGNIATSGYLSACCSSLAAALIHQPADHGSKARPAGCVMKEILEKHVLPWPQMTQKEHPLTFTTTNFQTAQKNLQYITVVHKNQDGSRVFSLNSSSKQTKP
jgi:hypothetical protein